MFDIINVVSIVVSIKSVLKAEEFNISEGLIPRRTLNGTFVKDKQPDSHLKIKSMIVFPILRSIPLLEVGIPVFFAICCFSSVMPTARFQLKLIPGMIFFAIVIVMYSSY